MIKKFEQAVVLIERLAAIHKEIIMIVMTLALCAFVLSKLSYGG
jgi:hypothetical protein